MRLTTRPSRGASSAVSSYDVAPPFIISREQIDTIDWVLDESIGVVQKQLGYRSPHPSREWKT